MASNETTIRSFEWGDLPTLAALQQANDGDVERWLRQPNLQPERDCILAYAGDEPIGYAYLMVETTISRGVLISGTAEGAGASVARALLGEAAAAARALGLGVLQVDVPEADSVARLLCEESTMRYIRTHHHMRRDGNETVDVAMPAGAATRLASRDDVAAVTELQNAAFTGSWGYAPNTEEEIRYRIFDLPSEAPDPVVLLEIDGHLMAYCWNHRDSPTSPGIVGMVGVWPDQQGKGYGKMVTGAGINHLLGMGARPVEISVDSENPPAIRVYENVGFSLDWRSFWYELALG
jgi:ribosomal protein S18 acetylase RimI-like enzyme